jgi:flagellin-like hook-associated protein FlgL
MGKPTATIDFGKYNKSNFRELYGKGFRVTCATCSGEYINVIFCYDKNQADFPESFEKVDEESGEMRTIHNLAVELKGMNSGSDIVSSIVGQLKNELDHYTGIEQGNPNTALLKVFDKRPGDIPDPDSPNPDKPELLRAEILSGVYTDCIYTVKENFYAAPDDIVGDIEIDYRQVQIFADAESVDHYIDIHLPYLTLKNLKLNPPEPDLSTPETAAETMKRVLNANNAISSMRGVLGADYNRLEHAAANLSQAAVQAADAYSRIRDADMAELMTERVKQSILQQAQQAAQAHTLEMPQQILKILQS